MALRIPDGLVASCRSTPERTAWLHHLPDTVEKLKHLWALKPEELLDAEEPSCSYVAAVRCKNGTQAVLKVAMPHIEGEHEIQGLRFWNGDPTVRLLADEDDLGAMLLERCEPGTPLRSLPEPEQDVVIARLLRRIWRVPIAPHPFRQLSEMTAYWNDETLTQAEHWPDTDLVR